MITDLYVFLSYILKIIAKSYIHIKKKNERNGKVSSANSNIAISSAKHVVQYLTCKSLMDYESKCQS